jgi:hypothetical protein
VAALTLSWGAFAVDPGTGFRYHRSTMNGDDQKGAPAPDLSRNVSVLLPLALLGGLIAVSVPIYGTDLYDTLIRSELGLIENGTALLALGVTIMAIRAWRYSGVMAPPLVFKLWLAFFALGGVYLAGEEISWGQHFFRWESPEYFQQENLQRETNLHNLVHMAELLPKFLLHMAAIFGGIIWPALVRFTRLRGPRAPGFFYWLMPTWAVFTAACIAIAIRIVERILANMGLRDQGLDFKEFKELNEFFLFLFVVYYLASLAVRARALAETETETETETPANAAP